MSFSLSEIVPWGRSFQEYVDMFSLTEGDLKKKILGCGDGPASFNAELSHLGGDILSIDPLYFYSGAQIQSRIEAVYPKVLAQASANKINFAWKTIKDVEHLGKIRMQSMNLFLSDYDQNSHRYKNAKLPNLPFADKTFDLTLCSHLLFLYSDKLDLLFHKQSLSELIRVSHEIRIYPLVDLNSNPSIHLAPLSQMLDENKIDFSLQSVDYEFQKGAKKMLRIVCNNGKLLSD